MQSGLAKPLLYLGHLGRERAAQLSEGSLFGGLCEKPRKVGEQLRNYVGLEVLEVVNVEEGLAQQQMLALLPEPRNLLPSEVAVSS